MCDICHKSQCDYRCPNAPAPISIYECEHCKEPIVAGDKYFRHGPNYYHESCRRKIAAELFAEKENLTKGVVTNCDAQIGTCPLCKEPVYSYEERWIRETTMYHHECLEDHANKALSPHPLIAEDEDAEGVFEY